MQQVDEKNKIVKMKRLNIVKIQMVKEKTFPYKTNIITNPSSAASLLHEFIGKEDREHFVLLCLDTKGKITALNTVSIGNLDSTIVSIREIFKTAILSNSAGIIVGHNHPSGCPVASDDDIFATKKIKDAGDLLGIELLDHIIVGDEGKYYSFKEKGYI